MNLHVCAGLSVGRPVPPPVPLHRRVPSLARVVGMASLNHSLVVAVDCVC